MTRNLLFCALLLLTSRGLASTEANAPKETTASPTTIVATKSETEDPHAHDDDLVCINDFGECIGANETCAEERAFLRGMCKDSPNRLCCIPSQHEIKLWDGDDEECLNQFGVCQLDTIKCTGKYLDYKCGGPFHRRCCSPDPEDVSKWSEDDTDCEQSLGKCQLDSLECSGEYQTGTCGGPKQRQCCLPGKKVQDEWVKKDDKCFEKWGVCSPSKKKCAGTYDKNICGGPDERQCCVPDKQIISDWKKQDNVCTLNFGKCQLSTKNCTGKLIENQCGGPYFRQCCVPDPKNIKIWAKDDKMCTEKGGICQSNGLPCHAKYLEGYCGGPASIRQCCTSPVKENEKVPDLSSPSTTVDAIMKTVSSNLVLILGVSIPSLLGMILALYCIITRQRTACCKPYVKLRGGHRKTPWYKMEYSEMEEEDVNLTLADDENKAYA